MLPLKIDMKVSIEDLLPAISSKLKKYQFRNPSTLETMNFVTLRSDSLVVLPIEGLIVAGAK